MLPVVFVFIVFVAGNAFASPLANQYIENVLNNALRNEIRYANLDPAQLSDFTTEFEDKVAIVGKVKGKVDFTKGNLTGLSEVRRLTECQGPFYIYGARTINCSINFVNLKIEYEGKMKYGKMPKVNIKGKANVTNTILFIDIISQSPTTPTTVKTFLFQQIGQLNIKFTGLGPLNKFTKFLENGFRSHVEAQVFNSMSQKFQYSLNRAVGMVPMPN